MSTPYSSTDSPYPLLTAWYYNRLRPEWIKERDTLRQEDPKLLVSVAGLEAAARLSAHITQEMERLSTDVHHRKHQRHFDDTPCEDELIEFHAALRGLSHSYRTIIGEISGNQHVWAEEERYLESVHYMTPEQLAAYEFNIKAMEVEGL